MNTLPRVAALERSGARSICLTLAIDAQLPVFDGHFNAHPVVPGVAQIDWAMRFTQTHIGCERAFAGMRGLKFLQVIQPPTTVRLDLDWDNEGVLAFAYYAPATGAPYSRGSLCFA